MLLDEKWTDDICIIVYLDCMNWCCKEVSKLRKNRTGRQASRQAGNNETKLRVVCRRDPAWDVYNIRVYFHEINTVCRQYLLFVLCIKINGHSRVYDFGSFYEVSALRFELYNNSALYTIFSLLTPWKCTCSLRFEHGEKRRTPFFLPTCWKQRLSLDLVMDICRLS